MDSTGERKHKKSDALVPVVSGVADKVIPGAGLGLRILGTLVSSVMQRSVEAKLSRWFSDVSAAQDFGGPEALARTIDEHIDEPWAYEGVVQGIRLSLDTIDDAVLPSLAALSADYFERKRPPDRFYKRCARLLADCDSRDLRLLASILDGLEKHAGGAGRIEIRGGEMAEGWEDVVFEYLPDPCGSELDPCEWRLGGSYTMQSLLRLLRAHDFAESAVTRDAPPMPYSQSSSELRATTRIVDDQLDELHHLRRYVVIGPDADGSLRPP